MVIRIFGKSLSGSLPLVREKWVYWAPSIRTGRMRAPALSAIMPGPS